MRFLLLLGVIGLVGAGCSRKATEKPTAPYVPPPPLFKIEAPAAAPPVPAVNPKELAQRLAHELASADPAVRAEAIRQLRELDPAVAYPYVLEAIKQPDTRLAGLSALSLTQAQQNQKELVPLLLSMLKDKDPAVRRQVCQCLTWVDRQLDELLQAGVQAQERLFALRMVVEEDEDEGVRLTAHESARSVQDAISGRIGGGADVALPIPPPPVDGKTPPDTGRSGGAVPKRGIPPK